VEAAMIEITIDEAVERLKNANEYLYAETIITLGYDEIRNKSYAYESYKVIIIKQWCYGATFYWHLCDVGDSDMVSAAEDFKNAFADDIKINYTYFLKDKPDDYDMSINEGTVAHLRFGGVGKSYNDIDIRLLSESDRKQILFLTTPNPVGNNYEFENVAQNLNSDFSNDNYKLIGIFDGVTLAGAVEVLNYDMKLMRVLNIFILRKYRGQGYATRLLRAALALYPGAKYDYDCEKSNVVSAASARSAGFILAGTFIPS
jgi:RimJ/RimL family protein N-acetyltransferase